MQALDVSVASVNTASKSLGSQRNVAKLLSECVAALYCLHAWGPVIRLSNFDPSVRTVVFQTISTALGASSPNLLPYLFEEIRYVGLKLFSQIVCSPIFEAADNLIPFSV